MIAPFLHAEVARAQSVDQGWAGIAPGDWSTEIAYDTAQHACESMQYSVVPAFGHQVFALLSITPRPGAYNPFSGAQAPAVDCQFDAGPNGIDTVRDFYGCSDGKYVHGSCLPIDYAVTAEPACDTGCKGIPGQYPASGDPVSLSSGAKFETVTDYTSGGPYPIEITRHYGSLNMPRDSESVGYGLAWRGDVVGRKIKVEWSGLNITVSREDGMQSRFVNVSNIPNGSNWTPTSIEVWYKNGTEYVQGQLDVRDRFHTENPYYVYQDENDRRDYFYARKLEKSVWKGGYQRNYVYAPDDYNGVRPIQISDSLGRVVNITWNGDLISEVSLPDGTKLQYSYEAFASTTDVPSALVLTQVARRKADGTLIDSTSYQYAAPRPGTQVPLLASVIDAAGRTIDSTTYDEIGRVLTAQGPAGANAVTIAYNDQTNTRTVTNALGQVEVYTFAKSGLHYFDDPDTSFLRMTSVARQASPTVPAASKSLTYSFGEYLKTDWNGIVTRLVYDDFANETSRIEDDNGLKRTTTTTWSPDFHLPTQIVGPNLTVDLTYDTSGRLTQRKETDTSIRNGPTRTWTYTWNALGLMTSVTGARTDVVQTTTYTYDVNGNLATVKDALNHITTINAVNASGLPTSITDENGVVTLMTYDPLGRIATVSVQGPTPATTTFGYDVNGLLTTVTAPNNVSLTYGYDDAHRLMSITDGTGNKIVFALDGLGNRTQTQIQTGSAQVLMANSASFDSLGRLLASIGAVNQTTNYQYDNNGNLTKLTDPRNAATQTAFDALNRVKQATDALNNVTKLSYDGQGNVTSVTDAKLHATTYTVNGFGFVTQAVSPDSGTTIYTYDLAGNIKSRKDARRIVTNYTYDALDRPLTRTYPTTTENVTYGYDSTANGNLGVGRLTSLTDGAGTANFTYDAYGNRIAEKRTISGIVYNTAYEYDLAGNVAKITYPSGRIVTYQRDGLGHVSGVTTQANAGAAVVTLAFNIGYLPFGGMQAMMLGNGVQITNSYDLDYRLTRTQATGPAAVQDLTLGYDAASNISSIADAVTANLSQTFQYDLVGRVSQGTGVYGTDNYTYDALGNRLTRSLVNGGTTSTTYTYTAANTQLAKAVTGSATLNYSYDANGSLITRKLGNQTQASYTYNGEGRLATGGSAALKYNAFGQRSVETVGSAGTHFIFDQDGMLLAEQTAQGALTRNYVYLNGVPLALIDGAGAVSYVLNDQIGQPQKMLNGSGAVSWQRVAGIFGDTVSQPIGSTGANPLRFPGQQFDANLGLHYNYFRDYDPATGRYLETDPIGLGGGMNLYAYAAGNPVRLVDPKGLYFGLDDLAFSIGGGVVGVGGQALGDWMSGSRSSWEDYAGAAIGGAIGGEALLYTGPVGAGAAGGFATNLSKQALKYLSGKECSFDGWGLLKDTGIGAATGFIPGLRIPGLTAGQGNYNSIYKQIVTKAGNETISSIQASTAGKMFMGRAVDKALLPGAGAGAVAGQAGQYIDKAYNWVTSLWQ